MGRKGVAVVVGGSVAGLPCADAAVAAGWGCGGAGEGSGARPLDPGVGPRRRHAAPCRRPGKPAALSQSPLLSPLVGRCELRAM
jgi:hypothetical protein